MNSRYVAPVVNSTAVFKDGIFNGKVLFCTGGGSGICKAMTEAIVRVVSMSKVPWPKLSGPTPRNR